MPDYALRNKLRRTGRFSPELSAGPLRGSGEGGIRTLDRGYPLCRFSKPVPSATRPPLRVIESRPATPMYQESARFPRNWMALPLHILSASFVNSVVEIFTIKDTP